MIDMLSRWCFDRPLMAPAKVNDASVQSSLVHVETLG